MKNPNWKAILRGKPFLAAVGVVGALVLLAVVWGVVESGKRGGRDDRGDGGAADVGDKKPPQARREKPAGKGADSPRVKTFACQVHTHQPGFFVLVDGEPARARAGKKLTTPCEIEIPGGSHVLTIVQEKFRDHIESVTITEEQTFDFTAVYEPFAEPSGFFASPLGVAKLGEPVELVQVNAGGPAWDPFVTADGLTLWFAGQKADGKGIYVSRRKNPYEDFGPAELVTRNSERPASPSTTQDGLLLAYALPTKAQIRSLVRTDAEAPFKPGPVLRQSDKDEDVWPSAQISADGKTLYYTISRGEKLSTRVTKRKLLRKPFDGEARSSRLSGEHARLSADGLRQFWFDGETLFRASRTDFDAPFSEPEVAAELSFDGYTSQSDSRQYCVSDDEQWLFYSDNPRGTGKLYAVRVADGPRRGYAPVGKPLPVRETAQTERSFPGLSDAPAKTAEPQPEEKVEAPVDPRSLPVPYAQFRDNFEKLVAASDYAAARESVVAAQADSELASAKLQLEWDLADVERLLKFHERVEESLGKLKAGDLVKFGTLQIEFENYADGVLSGKTKGTGKPLSKALADWGPLDVAGLVDKRIERSDEAGQLEVATFLAYSPKVSPQQLQLRYDRAGAVGKDIADQSYARRLFVVEQEIARDNLAAALQQIEQLMLSAPKSRSASQARELRDSLYSRIPWKPVGQQKWESPSPGEFVAAGGKSPAAYLAAPQEYRNFRLSLEWKTTGDTSQGGVFFHYKGTGELRRSAFKIQLIGDYDLRGQPDKFSTGSLFGIQGPKSNPVKPNGEWNTLQLRMEGDRVQVTINGVEVLDRPSTSKDVPPSGLVCLDGEFPGITYRKVLVYELPALRETGARRK